VEIPLEMKYNVFESKIGLNVVGGFSTFILTNNEVSFINPENVSTILGESNNINSLNFSGNLGFDIDYKVTKDWFLNVSPMVKYQFNTFSNTSGSFQPFYFGVYSGVNYRF
jgi:Leucine-rich repeat (LRR) protein